MSRYVYKLPDIGEGIAEAEIVKWHVEPGAKIEQDQALVDVMTDKATVEIAAPVSGVLQERNGAEGQKLAVGSVLAVLETGGGEASPAPVKDVQQAAPVQDRTATAPGTGKCLAAPAVRARARTLGVALETLQGSGPQGRILHDDLDRFLVARGGKPLETDQKTPEEVEEIQVFGLRRRIAERMQESKRRIPHFTYVEEIDVEELERERARRNQEGGTHLTLLPFVIRALTVAVGAHRQVNCHFEDETGKILRFRPVHVGIATQTE